MDTVRKVQSRHWVDRLEATDSDGLAAEVFYDYWVWPAMMAMAIGPHHAACCPPQYSSGFSEP